MQFLKLQSICLLVFFACHGSAVSAQNGKALRWQVPEDEVLILLTAGKYDELSKKLKGLQAAYMADSSTENEVHKAFYEFFRADANIARPLDNWIAAQPENAMAHLARGIYRDNMGWHSRGGGPASKTTDNQFSGMADWFNAAKEDLDRSIRLDATIVETYCFLIEIDKTEGWHLAQSLYRQALKIKPDSFIVREYYLSSQAPRWGGSYEAMMATISEAKPYYAQVPQLAALEGRVDADMGEIALSRQDYQTAIKHFKVALSKGDLWITNQKYGETLEAIGDHSAAIEQFSRVIQHKPGYKQAWEMRARSYAFLDKLPEALADITYAIGIEPRDDAAIAKRGAILADMDDFKAALVEFKKAREINPSNPKHSEVIKRLQNDLNMSPANHGN